MCHVCEAQPAVHKWMELEMCRECWEWVLEDNFWEMLGCDGDLLEFEEEMMELEVAHFRDLLDAD